MSWPLSQDYNEAIQDPRNSFSDAELKTGEAVSNPLGIPLPRSGNFADVYEVRCPSGSRWAVKCFTREVAGLRERYHEISKFLHQTNLPFMVDFQYLEQGIRVRGGWYPILKMQWVEGFVLNEFVRDNLDKKPILQAMGQIWLRMARRLRDAKLAHCDLQHGNVLLVPGSTANSLAVKLIDYDGMCVPALAGKKSGEVGHPAFQHPERLKTGAYNQEVDRFSLLAIAAGLRCLTVGGRSLWERYDNGDNLLFRQSDLQSPGDSPLFQELLEIPDAQGQSLVKELFRACRGSLDKVPLLTDLMPEEKRASKGATATAKQSAAGQGADWDFNEDESAPSVGKNQRASGKTPKWIWAAASGAAVMLVLGAGLMMRHGPSEKDETPIAQNKPETKRLDPVPKPPPDGKGQQPLTPVNPQPNPINPPVTPPPKPAEIASLTWDKPIDPNGDSTFKNVEGKLTITVPDKPRVLEAFSNRANAPRVLFDVAGDFTVQVRVGGDFKPAETSSEGGNSWIGAGLLLWVHEGAFLRLERAGLHQRKPSTLYANWEVRQDAEGKDVKHNFPSLSGAETYLRLERRSNTILAAFSEDGRHWYDVKPLDIRLPVKVKIGLVAGSTSARPFAPTFDQFQLKKSQGEMQRVHLPRAPAAETVAGKPRSTRQPVPEEAAIKAASKDLRRAFKQEFGNRGPEGRQQLRIALEKEIETATNDAPRLFVVLRELRNLYAEDDVLQSLKVARRMSDTFEISRLESECDALESASRVNTHRKGEPVLELLLPLVNRAIAEEDYTMLTRLLVLVRTNAAKSAEPALALTAKKLATHADLVNQQHDKVRADEQALVVNPDDAKANLTAGTFHCAYRDDWDRGLPLLAHGEDAALKKLAEKDLADTGEAAERVVLGDAWRDQAGEATGPMKSACLRRAYHWYQTAALDLAAGPKRLEVDGQLKKLGELLPELRNPCPNLGVHDHHLKRDAGADYVRLTPSVKVATRQYYRGPIDVTMVLRAAKNQFHLDVSHGSQSLDKSIAVPSNQWFTLRWRITAAGMKLWIDGQVIYEKADVFELTERWPVRIAVDDAPLEMKSLVINRARDK